MSKQTLVFILGISLLLAPFLGVPLMWRQYAIAFIGALLVIVGYALRRDQYLQSLDLGNGERGNDSFVETTEKLFDERA
jgi:hypothetical protein